MSAMTRAIQTNMPQHGRLSMFLPYLLGRIHQAPTEVAPSTHDVEEGEIPSVPDTPHFKPDQGDTSPEEPAMGTAARIVARSG